MDVSISMIQNSHKPGAGDPWPILLVEMVNLLALFLIHARHSKGARATTVLFDQMVSRLHILEKMPEHDGGMIIRRIGSSGKGSFGRPDYFLLFGNLAFRGSDALAGAGAASKNMTHLSSALDQAFGYFQEQGIHALYLQLPGKSAEKVDQLRLSLNIMARFRQAVENNASITFRYFGRALTVPLVSDSRGRPDPNLTIVAGLNGLSTINMRELIRQAGAFCKLSIIKGDEEQATDSYNQIFSVRSMRSQLIRPLIEINNLPWMEAEDFVCAIDGITAVPENKLERDTADQGSGTSCANTDLAAVPPAAFSISPEFLHLFMDSREKKIHEAVRTFFAYDYQTTDSAAFGNHLGVITLLLNTLEKHTSDPLPLERLFAYLHERLEQLPDTVLTHMTVQRRGLKLESKGRTVLVGMIDSRLMDLLVLVKERLATCRKIAAVRASAFDFNRDDPVLFADRFGIDTAAARTFFDLLKSSSDNQGKLDRLRFAAHAETISQYAGGLFEMLWCILRYTPHAQDRFFLLDTLALLAESAPNSKQALGFLMSDLFQAPHNLEVSDRNAFGLATKMLHTRNNERLPVKGGTPEEVLAVRNTLNTNVLAYAGWRMDIDAMRILSKFHVIRDALRRSLSTPVETIRRNDAMGVPLLLSLEREGIIFMALAGGKTARMVLREALAYYGDCQNDIYKGSVDSSGLPAIMDHLTVILRGMARLGQPQDLDRLKQLEQSAPQLMTLDADPGFARQVRKTMQWVEPAIRAIQVQFG